MVDYIMTRKCERDREVPVEEGCVILRLLLYGDADVIYDHQDCVSRGLAEAEGPTAGEGEGSRDGVWSCSYTVSEGEGSSEDIIIFSCSC